LLLRFRASDECGPSLSLCNTLTTLNIFSFIRQNPLYWKQAFFNYLKTTSFLAETKCQDNEVGFCDKCHNLFLHYSFQKNYCRDRLSTLFYHIKVPQTPMCIFYWHPQHSTRRTIQDFFSMYWKLIDS
jgi:hypothetical protein